mgnify:CR=1 FL=1
MVSDMGQWYELVPTRMGMILSKPYGICSIASCPHTHGDDPGRVTHAMRDGKLVPTRMGMILTVKCVCHCRFTCPHTHGDDPGFDIGKPPPLSLSPHAWG